MSKPRNEAEAFRIAARMFKRSIRGSSGTIATECDRAGRIASTIWDRWHVGPWQWQQKHVRWYLEHRATNYTNWTRYRYWLTIARILKAMGKLDDWRKGLYGPWRKPIDDTTAMCIVRGHVVE